MTNRFVLNPLTHCTTRVEDNFGKETLYYSIKLHLIFFVFWWKVRHNIEVSHTTSKGDDGVFGVKLLTRVWVIFIMLLIIIRFAISKSIKHILSLVICLINLSTRFSRNHAHKLNRFNTNVHISGAISPSQQIALGKNTQTCTALEKSFLVPRSIDKSDP